VRSGGGLVNFANQNNIFVYSIELEHPNLEDVFLKYTVEPFRGKLKWLNLRNLHHLAQGE
jgi:hypothetical protein